jgi:hypothetical protein
MGCEGDGTVATAEPLHIRGIYREHAFGIQILPYDGLNSAGLKNCKIPYLHTIYCVYTNTIYKILYR